MPSDASTVSRSECQQMVVVVITLIGITWKHDVIHKLETLPEQKRATATGNM